MSNRRSKNARRATYTRGPSRPVDPRRASGAYQRGYQRSYGSQRRGLDPFAMGLIIVVGLAVVLVILLVALQGSSNTSAGPSTSASNSNGSSSSGGSPTPNWTQTMV